MIMNPNLIKHTVVFKIDNLHISNYVFLLKVYSVVYTIHRKIIKNPAVPLRQIQTMVEKVAYITLVT